MHCIHLETRYRQVVVLPLAVALGRGARVRDPNQSIILVPCLYAPALLLGQPNRAPSFRGLIVWARASWFCDGHLELIGILVLPFNALPLSLNCFRKSTVSSGITHDAGKNEYSFGKSFCNCLMDLHNFALLHIDNIPGK